MRKFILIAANLLIIAGFFALIYPTATNLYSSIRLKFFNFSSTFSNTDQAIDNIPSFQSDPALSESVSISLNEEEIFAMIQIPSIKLDAPIYEGTTDIVLKKGLGWYKESALPGEGNTAIAGHRDIYGSWFKNLDKLKIGEEIIIDFQQTEFLYKVESVFITEANDWSVILPHDENILTLTTCHPLGSSTQRLIVKAKQK